MSATDESPSPHPFLADAEDLLELDPARAELWVSGLLADLDSAELAELIDVLRSEVGALDGQASDQSLAPETTARLLAAAIAVVADEEVAGQACEICSPGDIKSPSWGPLLGSAMPVDAMAVVVEGVRRSIVVRFAHSEEDRHLMLVELDDGVVTDLRFAPDGLFEDELGDESIELIPVALDGLGDELATALEPADLDTPSIALNRLVARRRIESLGTQLRIGGDVDLPPQSEEQPILGEGVEQQLHDSDEQREDDAAAVELLESALAKHFDAPGPDADTFEAIAASLVSTSSADIAAVRATAGLVGTESSEVQVFRFVSAYATPQNLDLFSQEERQAIRHLEWADWLGAVIGVTRAGQGTVVSPQSMVKAINRCPEITTTIPKADADYVAWSFELTLHAWSFAGVIDAEERLTIFGEQVLPLAFREAWQRSDS